MSEESNIAGLPLTFNGISNLVKRNGWSFVLAVILVLAVIYGAVMFVPRVYGDLEAITTSLTALKEDHDQIGPKLQEQACNSVEGNRIACASCWNVATTQDELERCACNPKPDPSPCRLH